MKITTNLDLWGGITLDIQSETPHENTLLKIIAGKKLSDCTGGISAGSDEPTRTTLYLVFREHDAKPAEAPAPLQESVAN